MRPPSARILGNVADHYAGSITLDDVQAPQYGYPAIPTAAALRCSAQPGAVEEMTDPHGRITRRREWRLLFAQPTGAAPKDRFVVTMPDGSTHVIFAHVERDEAGRGAAWTVFGTEML